MKSPAAEDYNSAADEERIASEREAFKILIRLVKIETIVVLGLSVFLMYIVSQGKLPDRYAALSFDSAWNGADYTHKILSRRWTIPGST